MFLGTSTVSTTFLRYRITRMDFLPEKIKTQRHIENKFEGYIRREIIFFFLF